MARPRHRWTFVRRDLHRCARCALLRRTCAPDERTAAGVRLFAEYRREGAPWIAYAGPCARPEQIELALVPPPSSTARAAATAAEDAAEDARLARRHPALPPAMRAHPLLREALRVFPDAAVTFVPAWAVTP